MASIKVAVRVRPFNKRERLKESSLIVEMRGNRTSLIRPVRPSIGGQMDTSTHSHKAGTKDDHTKYDFTYDHSYWSFDPDDATFATQSQVYEDLGRDVIDCAFQGYNACVFAYGQTGSGKTYTMMGTAEEPGLIPRTCRALFARQRNDADALTGYRTSVSYLEIYNEKVRDLLDETGGGRVLKIREHQDKGPYVENLSQHAVTDYPEIQAFIDQGNRMRTTASTNMNDTSSRSHAIFTITFTQAGFIKDMPTETESKIHLVDLAGSESAVATGATGKRLVEGAHINKSLVTLGSVINALAKQSPASANSANNNNPQSPTVQQPQYIKYRDSKLTYLLKDSLGGNSKTIMIAAISPADCNYNETLNTLRYANRAKNIINTPTVNEDANVKLIRELREEIKQLRQMLSGEERPQATTVAVLENLKRMEAQEKELTDEWTEKWCEVQAILREQKALGLRMSGAGVVLDSKHPHLIGIPDDKETGVTLYSLHVGETMIGSCTGRQGSATGSRIMLRGESLLPEHCSIVLEADGRATIVPRPNAKCWLNRSRIGEATAICQGDLLVLGGTNVFRFNNPAEAALLKEGKTGCGGVDAMRGSRQNVSAASMDNLLSSIICNSDDEISFVCPLPEETDEDQREDPTNQQSPTWDVDSLKHLNDQERTMLDRKQTAFEEKRSLRARIDKHSQRIRYIESELHQLEPTDANAESIHGLEDELVQSEMQLTKYTGSMAALNEEIHSLEMDHRALILTRRRFENEALHLNKFNGLQFHSGQRTKSLMHLSPSGHTSKGMDRCASALFLPRYVQPTVSEVDTKPTPTIHIQYDSSQSMEHSSDGGISSQSGDPLNTSAESQSPRLTGAVAASASGVGDPDDDDDGDDDAEDEDQGVCADLPICCRMQALRHKIAYEKATVMKYLEVNSEKRLLDESIDRLQELQRQNMVYEKRMATADARDALCAWHKEAQLDDGGGSPGRYRSVYASRSNLSSSNGTEYAISVPGYVLCGSGSSAHYEYEITISLDTDKWSIQRRYSRFREMHLAMKRLYGDAVAQISFPRRQIFFPQTESVAFRRRRQLEFYLRRLLVVCSKLPGCPIYEDDTSAVHSSGLTRASLLDFSSFFRQGVCECGQRSVMGDSLTHFSGSTT